MKFLKMTSIGRTKVILLILYRQTEFFRRKESSDDANSHLKHRNKRKKQLELLHGKSQNQVLAGAQLKDFLCSAY